MLDSTETDRTSSGIVDRRRLDRRGARDAMSRGESCARGLCHDHRRPCQHSGVHGHGEWGSKTRCVCEEVWGIGNRGVHVSPPERTRQLSFLALERKIEHSMSVLKSRGRRRPGAMMREAGPAYENATERFDDVNMEWGNRRARRRFSTTNAVLAGCVRPHQSSADYDS